MKLFGALCFAAVLAASANAATIYDNTSYSTNGRDPVYGVLPIATPYGPLYNQFVTDTTSATGFFQINSLQLILQNCDNTDPSSQDCYNVAGGSGASVNLYRDNGSNAPSTLIANLGHVSDSSLTTTPTLTTIDLSGFTPTDGTDLTPGSLYWIGLVADNANTLVSWNWDGTAAGYTPNAADLSGLNYANAGIGVNNNAAFPGTYQMQVGVTDYTPSGAPEPVSGVLFGTGAVLIGLYRRRKNA